ncbi:hypothetical protein L1987_06447 [Smallanthus sonchifolius]|uniref:Uncharacterized protein n=1 Tax=Smallanthus sonchifolius TaxID=185202 RepID=A0ACB9JYD9_9ASTR|nr:hypothetical protein L1987_06447 [Smallanthus sonchifolius]
MFSSPSPSSSADTCAIMETLRTRTGFVCLALYTIKEGFQDATFIKQLLEDESQMEATHLGCSKITNWHLHLEAHKLGYRKGWLLQKNINVVLPISKNKSHKEMIMGCHYWFFDTRHQFAED